jgi:hypothetical protein
MSTIEVYCQNQSVNIKQTRIKRDWMESTGEKHAYKCFPVSIANTLGYELSLPVDVSFIWDGINDSSSEHVKVLSGEEFISNSRANATVSFKTGIVIKSNKNVSFLHMPVPNLFNDLYQAFTTIISTSFFDQEFPSAIRILKPNTVITIKAGEPFVTLLPISLAELSNIELNLKDFEMDESWYKNNEDRGKAAYELNKKGEWTNWYRNATDHNDIPVGDHEVKSLKLTINDQRRNNG